MKSLEPVSMPKSPLWLLLLLAGCVTINVYFPEAEIRELSERIEAEVRGEPVSAEEGESAAEPPRFRLASEPARGVARGELRWAGLGGLAGVLAIQSPGQGVPEPAVMTPAIRKIVASRRTRHPELERWKAQGVVGENNRALAEARDLQQVADLRQRAEVQRLLREENADREQLFREIAAAEGVDLSQLPRIQQTYADTMRRVALPGQWVQMPDGSWVRKQ
ncbi:MAG TPA: DUF1318 domain-containing protein [Thermoanaerobaculia bacterium]|nr:DUF1318 domain-containing protein [Thermoanaerobaculia bacterium]